MSVVRSINKAILVGNLTRDPEIRDTDSGSKICTFGLATDSIHRCKDGTEQEIAEFHTVVAWNKLGEICNDLLRKGMLVYIEGEIKTRSWETGGVKVYKTDIRASDMKLLDDKNNNANNNRGESQDYN